MTTVFRKVVDDEGNETFVEVDLNEIELPETHPIVNQLARVKEESIKRRQRIKELRAQLEAEERDDADSKAEAPEQPEQQDEKPAPVPLDPKEIARLVREELLAEERAKREAQKAREKAINKIIQETGLNERFRPVIERIEDLDAAEAAARELVSNLNAFDIPPSSGAGGRTVNDLLTKADKLLELDE